MALKDLTPLETTLLTKFLKRHLKDRNDMYPTIIVLKDTPETRAFVEAIERGTDAGPIEYEGLCIQGDRILTEDFIILEHLLQVIQKS